MHKCTNGEGLPRWGRSALLGPAPAGTSLQGLQQPYPAVVYSVLLPAGGPDPSPAHKYHGSSASNVA